MAAGFPRQTINSEQLKHGNRLNKGLGNRLLAPRAQRLTQRATTQAFAYQRLRVNRLSPVPSAKQRRLVLAINPADKL